jgi:hypothetical protein
MVLEYERQPVSTCSSAMLDTEQQLLPGATQKTIAIAPGMEFGRTAQGLPPALVGGALAGMM